MSDRTWDVIVLGGGTMGTAAAWALSQRGVSVLVLEQFGHIHSLGSHGGGTRMFRHAYAEGPRVRAPHVSCRQSLGLARK